MVRAGFSGPLPHPIVREILPPDTKRAFSLLADLFGWPFTFQDAYVERVDRVLRPTGYRLLGAFHEDAPAAVAILGFRLIRSNSWGDHLWVDDLIAGDEVGASAWLIYLMAYLEDEAKRLRVQQIHLDVPDDEGSEKRAFAARDPLAALADAVQNPIPRGPVADRVRAAQRGFERTGLRMVRRVDDHPPAPPEIEPSAPYPAGTARGGPPALGPGGRRSRRPRRRGD